MPQNSNFRLPRGHRLRPKLDLTVMAPNHGGAPLGSILGPMRSHWGQKMGQNRKKLLCPKIRIFNYHQSSILAKIWPHAYGSKSRWGPHKVHIGANGVHLGPKNGSKPKKNTMPQNSNFRLPCGHRFRPKLDFTGMASNQGRDPLGSILGPMGFHWGQKMGQNRKKLPSPKIRIFDYHADINFGQNWTLRLWRQITVGPP